MPSEIIDAVSKAFQNQTNFKQEIQSTGEVAQNLWEVILTPEFQEGVDNGDFIMKKGSLEIRNSKTGWFVGKAQLKEAEQTMEKIDKAKQTSSLSNISRSICTLSGQMQVAEISKKLEAIDEKLDRIDQFLWRSKVTELNGVKSVIEGALDSLPNQRALDRINECILQLTVLSEFFESTIENILKRKIQYSLAADFIEGLKIWEIAKKNRTEYNSQYIKKAKEFINEYGFLMELYFQTLGLIGTCYQIVDEYRNAKKYYYRMNEKINLYSLELVNKLVYIFNIKGIGLDDNITISDISRKLDTRNLPLLDSIRENNIVIESAKKMHSTLNTQFENVKVSYLVDSKLFWRIKTMTESNCPACNQRRKFSKIDEKKYKCDTCKTIYGLCKSKNCNNMINLGLFCKECMGKGMKSGGSVVITTLVAAGGIAIKTMLKKVNELK
ncbi:hypothetical protein MGI18_13895 [Bacillus sp. OVS6]|nr:hypothetical protein MGI18_13895 [Bacillus sp. OVS6]